MNEEFNEEIMAGRLVPHLDLHNWIPPLNFISLTHSKKDSTIKEIHNLVLFMYEQPRVRVLFTYTL